MIRAGVGAGVAALSLLLSACSGPTESPEQPDASPSSTATGSPDAGDSPATEGSPVVSDRVEPDLDLALSEPVEDSVYPEVGGPGIDALLYDLDLSWEPEQRTLTGTATITFRAARSARKVTLDLAAPLEVESVTVDGEQAAYKHRGKDLVVRQRVAEDDRHELVVSYAGQPQPIPAPTTRSDLSTVGLTVTDTGAVWTMQEPYGAHTWYPVNDQPADKALYDITVSVPDPWTGVANGRLVEDTTADGVHTTAWQLDEPASSYLLTLAIDDYEHSSDSSASGVRLDYWFPRGRRAVLTDMQAAAGGVDWIEDRLGPYPFSSAGIVLVDSESAMETQTMVTIGDNDYVRSPAVIVHELVHQWYGDQVSPADWRDVWLNEGMTMLMQGLWEADEAGAPIEATMSRWRAADQTLRDDFGPPGAYDEAQFGSSNIYYSPALMWNELRVELGDEEFFRVARSWLEAQDNESVTRNELYAHWEGETGLELTRFFAAWIDGSTTPPRGLLG
ncbi:M1 family metallopeptidase [Nocardioides piscis]|uniref:Aminopeptidase N n=1 Tax=Nocardioides piscis TaxID=2714938 RepID=A0A6G7YE40_9ACTN|nr:M1 family metallopeptidase [Nocardioides piscis]QIK75063.1 M1 family metallopeptidase [Nocardioides piscis]